MNPGSLARVGYLVVLCAIAARVTKAVPMSLAPYNGNISLVRLQTINEIEELIKQEVTNSLLKTYLGLSPEYTATSCKQMAELRPDYESGYYWVQGPSGPTGVYCEIGGEGRFDQGGGWMRIAKVDMRDGSTQCPRGLESAKIEDKELCQRPRAQVPGCVSTNFPVQSIEYIKVCGKVIGYQYYDPNGFGPSVSNANINSIYLDGVSITHGSPRRHVWSLAAARDEVTGSNNGCPCIDYDTTFRGIIPSYVGSDYYCETGSRNTRQQKYYFTDPLWDGEGCKGSNHCCERGGPWFCTELTVATKDDIELRVCGNGSPSYEDIVIETIELYVQ